LQLLLEHFAGAAGQAPAPVAELVTWKSLKIECPHWAVWPTGVSNV
jgi:hypothetical protein